MTTTSASVEQNPTAVTGVVWEPVFPGCLALSQNSCANNAFSGGCAWDSNNSTCVPVCRSPQRDATTCTAAAGCAWNGSQCYFAGCSTITDVNLCTNINMGCTWANGACSLSGLSERQNGSITADFTGAVAGITSLTAIDRSVSYGCAEGCTVYGSVIPQVDTFSLNSNTNLAAFERRPAELMAAEARAGAAEQRRRDRLDLDIAEACRRSSITASHADRAHHRVLAPRPPCGSRRARYMSPPHSA